VNIHSLSSGITPFTKPFPATCYSHTLGKGRRMRLFRRPHSRCGCILQRYL